MRNQRGQNSVRSKFTQNQVEGFRLEYSRTKITQSDLAKREGVSRLTMHRILGFKSYE